MAPSLKLIKEMLLRRILNKLRLKGSNQIQIAPTAKLRQCKIEMIGENNQLIIDDNCHIRKTHIEIIGNNCTIHIGSHAHIGDNSYLSAREKHTAITIGQHACLSRNARLMTSDGHDILKDGTRINPAKSISIGKHAWLTDNVTILKGVTIGDDAIIGINSTVTKSVGCQQIAAGNPAKVVADGVTSRDCLTY